MRTLAAFLVLAGLLASVASAAAIDPEKLVIRATDIPAGYDLDRNESGVFTNARAAKELPAAASLFRTWGRVTGYQAIWERGERKIEARVDVFRSSAGARAMLRWADTQASASGAGFRRARAGVGAEGWVFDQRSPWVESYVYWRHRTVWSALGGYGVTKQQALALARVQQRRIAAALG